MTKRSMSNAIRCLGLAAAAFTVTACASASLPSEMAARPGSAAVLSPGDPGYRQLHVSNVQGGADTNPLWMSNVSNNDLRTALESSLRAFNLLADDSVKATLEVTANMVDLQRPFAGLDMTVTSKVRYSVVPTSGGPPKFDQTIAATGTATMGQELLAVERLRKANEASIQANIESFIQQFEASMDKAPAKP